ncbi:MAG: hypothetical protein HYW07_02575 [Candidatus Latescibacteria bacterium]|nr:hypothetical protein [Candidatus Latescibacterota bacterium]
MRDNLSFAVGGIGNVHLQDVDVVRCFNVLLYFDDKFREQALDWFQGVLREGGLLFCGANSALSTGFRYFVYQKRGGRLLGREFALTMSPRERVRGIMRARHPLGSKHLPLPVARSRRRRPVLPGASYPPQVHRLRASAVRSPHIAVPVRSGVQIHCGATMLCRQCAVRESSSYSSAYL